LAVPKKAPAGLRAQIAHAVAMMLALLKIFEIRGIRGNTVRLTPHPVRADPGQGERPNKKILATGGAA
jgi:hypothetical protein